MSCNVGRCVYGIFSVVLVSLQSLVTATVAIPHKHLVSHEQNSNDTYDLSYLH